MNIYWEEHENLGAEFKPEYKPEYKLGCSTANIVSKPCIAGGYDISGGNGVNSITFNLVRKPNWFHRKCAKFFLGWKWNDKK